MLGGAGRTKEWNDKGRQKWRDTLDKESPIQAGCPITTAIASIRADVLSGRTGTASLHLATHHVAASRTHKAMQSENSQLAARIRDDRP
jgi:hypothetical protein